MDEILAALESINGTGSYYSEKKIRLDHLDIKIKKIGTIGLPITETNVKDLIGMAEPAKFGWKDQTIFDQDVRKVWEIPSSKVSIAKKLWSKSLDQLLNDIKNDLGLPKKSKLKAELHNLLIYEKGDFFKPHQDTEKLDNMVATLVIILPSNHEGGELIINHCGEKKIFQSNDPKLNKLLCIAFYADCYHEVKEITSGHRVSLTYNLILENYNGNLQNLYEPNFNSRLEVAFKNYFTNDHVNVNKNSWEDIKPKKIVCLLDHQYTQKGLSWNNLKNTDQVRVEAILNIANRFDLDAYLALADMHETWECEFNDNDYYNRRRYRNKEDDAGEAEGAPVYIIDSSIMLRHWLDKNGNAVEYKDFTPSNCEICSTSDNAGFKPYESEYEGWMGNYGNTLDRWYHRAAIVLWRKQDNLPIRFEIDQDGLMKEVFESTNSEHNLLKTREILSCIAPYWQNYAKNHKEKEDIVNILNLALYINDNKLSLQLLTMYNISIFNLETLTLWHSLIKRYGNKWCLSVLELLTTTKEWHYDKAGTIIDNFVNFIQELSNNTECSDIGQWLINYQLEQIFLKHKNSYNNNVTKKVSEITDLILGTIIYQNQDIHLKIISHIIAHENYYPYILLIDSFERCANRLDKAFLGLWGYKKLFEYINKSLITEHDKGLRDKDDWSINKKCKCSCQNCKITNDFLSQSTVDEKIWPLAQDARKHVESEIKALQIPVDTKIVMSGRPYQLILTKTSKLYENAKNRYDLVQKALKKMNQLSAMF